MLVDITTTVARWILLAATVVLIPELPVVTERSAIAIADRKVKELGYYRHPIYRARELKTKWHILVQDEGVYTFGSHHFITIDKRTGKVINVQGGK